jgi:hypothetical protein
MVAILLISHLHSYISEGFNLVFPNYLDNSVIWWILEYNMEFLLEEIIESTSYLCHARYHENMSQSEYFMAYLFTNHSPLCCVHTATLLNIPNLHIFIYLFLLLHNFSISHEYSRAHAAIEREWTALKRSVRDSIDSRRLELNISLSESQRMGH